MEKHEIWHHLCSIENRAHMIPRQFWHYQYWRKECTMKKLSVILLAAVFVFGLAVQASADFSDDVEESVFSGDTLIDFDNLYTPDDPCPLIDNQFEPLGVVFLDGWYLESFFSVFYWNMPYSAGNMNLNNLSVTQTPISFNLIPPVTRVGFDIQSYQATVMTIKAFRDGTEVGTVVRYTGEKSFIGMEDPQGIDSIQISANGWYSWYFENQVLIDNLRFGGTPETGPTEIPVTMYVKPPNCSGAPINVRSRGVTPVVIVGKDDVDVTMIDVDSIELQGVAPVRSAIEDVPYCNSEEPDGIWDLTLKFDTQELVQAMAASLDEGQTLATDSSMTLKLTGCLLNDTSIVGEDQVTIKGKPEKENKGKQKGKK
jgi:hypothetical protein